MTLIVAALLRTDAGVLLVQQRGPGDAAPNWALPGGVVEPGALPTDALVREVREETGLELIAPDRLLYTAVVNDPAHSVALIFEAAAWRGELGCADPDGWVTAAAFVPLADAIEKLRALPWRNMREPIVAFLEGRSAHGALWVYRRLPDGGTDLVSCLGGGTFSRPWR